MSKKKKKKKRESGHVEAGRKGAAVRWANTTAEQRRDGTAAAREALQARTAARRRDRLAATLKAIELDEGIGYFMQKAERARPDLDLDARYRVARTLRREQQRRIRQAGL